MCISDDIDQLNEAAFHEIAPDLRIIDQVVAFFRARYVLWGRHPDLSRR